MSVPTVCSEAIARKRLQQDSGEERVAAKSRQMMSLTARTPSFVSSSTSVSPVKRSYGNQNLWSSIAEKEERPESSDHYYYHEQFMESFSSAKQVVDIRETQVTEKTTKIPKITQQVENTQYQLQKVS